MSGNDPAHEHVVQTDGLLAGEEPEVTSSANNPRAVAWPQGGPEDVTLWNAYCNQKPLEPKLQLKHYAALLKKHHGTVRNESSIYKHLAWCKKNMAGAGGIGSDVSLGSLLQGAGMCIDLTVAASNAPGAAVTAAVNELGLALGPARTALGLGLHARSRRAGARLPFFVVLMLRANAYLTTLTLSPNLN